MSDTPVQLSFFEGGNALSAFRAQALLPRLQQACSRVTGVSARHVHWVASDRALERRRPRQAWRRCCDYRRTLTPHPKASWCVVMPRLGTLSPWASKATDIAHNCGLALRRVERVTEYRLTAQECRLLGGAQGR